MNFKLMFVSVLTVLAAAPLIHAQNDGSANPRQTPPPIVVKTPAPTPKLSETLSKNIETLGRNDEVSRERREQSYAKLLEGQRYLWMMRQRSQRTEPESGRRLYRARRAHAFRAAERYQRGDFAGFAGGQDR